MRILYLHQYFKKPSDNGGTRSYDLARGFVKKGFKVDMITTTSDRFGFKEKKWKHEVVDGIHVHYLFLPYDNSLSYFRRIGVFFAFLWYSSFKLLRLRGDLVLATSTPLTIAIPALIKKAIHKTPYIFEVRDVWPEAVIAIGAVSNRLAIRALYTLEKMAYRRAKFIVPLSTDMRMSIISRYPQFASKTNVIIENIAEIDRFKYTYSIENENAIKDLIGFTPRFSILYAGTFGKVNDIDYALKFAKILLEKDTSIVFLLLGNGAEKARLIKLGEKLGVYNKNVFFLEAIEKGELPRLYNRVSMGSSFVAPIKALWANSANKFFDTLAAGKPILINYNGWQSDMVKEYKVGYVLDPQLDNIDVDDFISFTYCSSKLEQSKVNAIHLASEKYSLAVAIDKYVKLFNESNV